MPHLTAMQLLRTYMLRRLSRVITPIHTFLKGAKSGARLLGTASSTQTQDHVIFSGIQPTGIPHLGNYLGALQQWVKLQSSASPNTKLLYSIVNLHALTVPQDPQQLKQWTRESLATLLAIGLDPDRSILFYQSSVRLHHLELFWILNREASQGQLSRMTQWKSKFASTAEASPLSGSSILDELPASLFSYPVLMAADILVHRATHVPVGEDQSQHLEFARKSARKFNHAYGPHLVLPKTIMSAAKRVMSLQEPHLKMSKSHSNPRSRILITDSSEEIHRKLMSAVTDSTNSVSYDPKDRPGVSNLLDLLSHFDSQERSAQELSTVYSKLTLKDLKITISDTISARLSDTRERYKQILSEDAGAYVDHIEKKGAKKARENAEATMVAVREAVGYDT